MTGDLERLLHQVAASELTQKRQPEVLSDGIELHHRLLLTEPILVKSNENAAKDGVEVRRIAGGGGGVRVIKGESCGVDAFFEQASFEKVVAEAG